MAPEKCLMKNTNHIVPESINQIVPRRTMQNIPDGTAGQGLSAAHYDVLGAITGYAQGERYNLFQRFCEQFPEVKAVGIYFKFPGRGSRKYIQRFDPVGLTSPT